MNLNWGDMGISTDQLRELNAVAKCGSYTEAARQLNISQSSLSRHIAALGKDLGYVPFGEGHLVEIGEIDKLVLSRAVEMLDFEERLRDDVAHLRSAEQCTVRFLKPQTADSIYLDIFNAARETKGRHPGFSLKVVEGKCAASLESIIESGEADVALTMAVGHSESTSFTLSETCGCIPIPCFDSPLCIAVPTGHWLAGKDRVVLADLAGERILIPMGVGFENLKRTFAQLCAEEGFRPVFEPVSAISVIEFFSSAPEHGVYLWHIMPSNEGVLVNMLVEQSRCLVRLDGDYRFRFAFLQPGDCNGSMIKEDFFETLRQMTL